MANGRTDPTQWNEIWGAAGALARHMAAGGSLPSVASPVFLERGEILHVETEAYAWRYQALATAYLSRRSVGVGGPVASGVTAVASLAGNRRARAIAQRQAAPQWRQLGSVGVLATSYRLLVAYDCHWSSVWYPAIRQLRPALDQDRLEIIFENDPPYALAGSSVPYLSVVISAALANLAGTDAVADMLAVAY